ncbi:MAG: ATP-binding cassette domain-containing protein, partial [Bacteroidota bacterium]
AETVENLRDLNHPAILHIVLDNRQQHYVVYYGFSGEKIIIGDPGSKVELWTKEKLDELWQSKTLLKLVPGEALKKSSAQPVEKYKNLIQWLDVDKNILIASLFLGSIIALFSLATAIFSQKLIDVILPTGEISKLIVGISLFALVLMARAGLGFVRSTFLITQSRDFNNRMVGSFFNSLLSLPKAFFDSKKIGEMIARLNDTSRIQLVISNLVGNMLIEVLIVTLSVVGVFIYSVPLGLIVTAFMPLYLLILIKLNGPILDAQKNVMVKYAMNEGNYIDVISGISEIKTTNTENLFHNATTFHYHQFQESIFNLGKIRIRFNLLTEVAGMLLMIIIIAFASYLVLTNQLLLGALMAIIGLSGAIRPSLTKLVLFNIQLQEAKVAFNRIEEFTKIKPETLDGVQQSPIESLKFENMTFHFPGSLALLKNINMEIEKGHVTALIGESGTGKSTIMQLLQRFYQPVAGRILANGEDINSKDLSSYRSRIGVVPQDIKIFNHHLLFNIALSKDKKDLEKAMLWCQDNGFHHFFSKFPQGYMTLLGEEGANISGGQKQLVGLARALFRKPDVLLIDEGTSAMDSKTESFILKMIHQAKNEAAVLMITHRRKVAESCDFVFSLENGEVTKENEPAYVV